MWYCILSLSKVRRKATIRNGYNQVPYLAKDTAWESDKTQENITYMEAKRSTLSQQVTTRLQETHMTDRNIKFYFVSVHPSKTRPDVS